MGQEQIFALMIKSTFSSLDKCLPNETNLYSFNRELIMLIMVSIQKLVSSVQTTY